MSNRTPMILVIGFFGLLMMGSALIFVDFDAMTDSDPSTETMGQGQAALSSSIYGGGYSEAPAAVPAPSSPSSPSVLDAVATDVPAPEGASEATQPSAPVPVSVAAPEQAAIDATAGLDRNASMHLRVRDARRSMRIATAAVGRMKGQIISSRVTQEGEGGDATGRLVCRVPATKFDTAVNAFRTLGALIAEDISGEERADAQADMERRAAENLATIDVARAQAHRTDQTPEQRLNAEQVLARLEAERRTLDAQRQALALQVRYARIHLLLQEDWNATVRARFLSWAPVLLLLAIAVIYAALFLGKPKTPKP